MKYGYFDDDAREYVITRPDTPLPWINYIGCQSYFGILSATGGGYSYYRDARLRRLTRGRYNNVPTDFGGRYIYLRDNADGDFWSPSWMPTQSELEDYTCRHGMGYSTISSKRNGIRSSTRYFVPLDETLEIWQVTVTNERQFPADVSLFSSVEFCLWEALDDATNFQRNLSTGQVEVEDGVIYHKTEYRERRNHFAYFACSEEIEGFDTQREDFLGAWRGWDKPLAVTEGRSRNSIAHGWSPMGSHQVSIKLMPGESRQVIFVLGYHENDKDDKFDPPGSQTLNKRTVKPLISKYCDINAVEEAFAALGKHWDALLNVYQVSSPDEHANRMVNIWNAYQCMATFNMSRSASSFESGIGRGLGFRDSNQDLLGFVHMVPSRARERILDIAATQLASGGAYHQYQPLTKKGNNDIGGDFNDDPHWLIIGVAAYLKETGDFAILDEPVMFDCEPGTEEPLYEHLKRSIQYALERKGPHGLPLIGRADWNDCLNLNCFSDTPGESFQTTTGKDGKVAESVFIAGLMVLSAKELADIAKVAGRDEDATFYTRVSSDMKQTILEHGWDGDWFLRAYDDYGHKVGSHENKEGKIFIESQGFCVLAGVGLEDGKAEAALESVAKHLATPHGIVLQQPAFSDYVIEYGEISTYPPGYKENAGIFCHNNPWVSIGEAMLGNGDRAFDYYTRICPSAREGISDVHRLEPYVYAQMIAGRDAPTHGEAKNSWLTGTAAWNYYTITQWIFGIRPDYSGLRIAPRIPERWTGFTVSRTFRGVTYHIAVSRKGPGNSVALSVDGVAVDGEIVPPPSNGAPSVRVEAVIG
ncbi:cellobiose phosphorylase [Cohaesibacter sp. ES.047]|uniref:GH36-type glycosyl hydrolase domain-containing protein n=1 Tax=Cohaesibacter sp. ES.047 TaxID=1798205 RepID=UPI000BB8F098|nr:glycosyl hydrolase family 65 protein [Cohaesibacter sp. ES.047]SNY94136.1 cellobiose phosphorylase [Cohaesibacter sp. ES.047]